MSLAIKLKEKIEARTIPELFRKRVERNPAKIAFVHVYKGKWTPVSYGKYFERCKKVGLGLVAAGMHKGDMVSIWSNNRAEWYYTDLGCSLLGGVPVGIYQTNTAEQGAYIISHSNSKILIAEGREEVDKVLSVWDQLPMLEKIFTIEHVEVKDPRIRRFQELFEMGERLESERPNLFEERYSAIRPDDLVTLVYTSGTTGPPKGVMLTHTNCLYFLEHYFDFLPVTSEDVTVAFLPLCHVGGRMGGHYVLIYSGMTGVFAESWEELLYNLSEVRPTFIGTTPRIIEKFHSMVETMIDEAPKVQQILSRWSQRVGAKVSEVTQGGKSPGPLLRFEYLLADLILFRKIRDIFGGKIRYFVSGGAPISKKLIDYFHAVGILILESYGLSEGSGSFVQNQRHDFRFGSVGKVFPGSEIKIMDDGEICYRGPATCQGYFKDPEGTRELIDSGRWLHTGDIGIFDQDGYLFITDRKKDIMITSGGKNVAPQNIENLLKTSKYISHACVFGDGRKYLTALVTLDEDEILKYARDNKIIFKDLRELTKDPRIVKLISNEVKEKNQHLHHVEQIKYFRILEEELDQDEGEITPTMKVKRKVMYQRYKDLVESMYQ